MRPARIISNSVALFSLDLLNKALPLLVFPWVVRALGPSVYGQLGFAGAVAGFFALLASPGFTVYALREAARNPGNIAFLMRHVVGARIVFAAGSFCLLAVFTFFFVPHEGETQLLIMLSGLAFVVNSLDIQWIFAARSRMWIIAARGALAQVAYAGLIFALLRRPGDAWVVPAAIILSAAVSAVLLWVPARRQYHIPWPSISPQTWQGFLPICLTIGFASLMSMFYDQIDTVMLKYFRSSAEVGMYVAAYSLMTAVLSFPPILGQVFGPLLSETAGRDANSELKYLGWLGHAMTGLALPAAAGGFVLATPLVRWLLGSQYSGSGILFRWLMLTVLAGSLATYFGAQLIPNGRERKYLIAVVCGAVSNIVLNLLLIPRYGALAAAFTTAFSQGIVAFMNYYFVRDLPRTRLSGPLLRSLPATLFMVAGILAAQRVFSIHVAALVAGGILLYMTAYLLTSGLRGWLQKSHAHSGTV